MDVIAPFECLGCSAEGGLRANSIAALRAGVLPLPCTVTFPALISGHRALQCVPALRRIGNMRQLGANRHTRKIQLAGAYRCVRTRQVRNRHILLIDDVMTTGATLEAAARCLHQAGVASVSAAVFVYKQ